MDVEAAIRYPLNGEDGTRNVLIGGGLLLLGVLINFVAFLLLVVFVGALLFPLALIPQILVQGYLVRVLRSTVAGGTEPPAFDDPTDLGLDGLKLVAVATVYSIPVVVVAGVLTAVLVGVSVLGTDPEAVGAASGVALAVAAVGGVLAFVLLAAIFYLVPIGLCAMVHEGEVRAAFDLGRLRRVGTDRDYAVAWGIGAAVMTVGGGIGQMLFVLLVGFPIAFAAQVAGFRLFALGYAEALDLDGSGPGSATPSSDDRGDATATSARTAGAASTTSGAGGDPTTDG